MCDFCLCTLYRIVLCGGGKESDYSSCRSKATDVLCSFIMLRIGKKLERRDLGSLLRRKYEIKVRLHVNQEQYFKWEYDNI